MLFDAANLEQFPVIQGDSSLLELKENVQDY